MQRAIALACLAIGAWRCTYFRELKSEEDAYGLASAAGLIITGTLLMAWSPSKKKRRRKYEPSPSPSGMQTANVGSQVAAYQRDVKAAAWSVSFEGRDLRTVVAELAERYGTEGADVRRDIEALMMR